MSLDSTEEEQIDQIKQFFRENGLFMLIAVILVVGGNIGYDYYETSERTAAEAASLDFSISRKLSMKWLLLEAVVKTRWQWVKRSRLIIQVRLRCARRFATGTALF